MKKIGKQSNMRKIILIVSLIIHTFSTVVSNED